MKTKGGKQAGKFRRTQYFGKRPAKSFWSNQSFS